MSGCADREASAQTSIERQQKTTTKTAQKASISCASRSLSVSFFGDAILTVKNACFQTFSNKKGCTNFYAQCTRACMRPACIPRQTKSGQYLDRIWKNLIKNIRKTTKTIDKLQKTTTTQQTSNEQKQTKHKSSKNSIESIILSILLLSIGTHVWVRSSRSERTDKHRKTTKDHNKKQHKRDQQAALPVLWQSGFF